MSRSAPSGAGASATRRREPTVSTTAAWAGSRRGARRWTRWRGCWSCDPLLGPHGQALPREAGGRSRLQAQLQLAAAELASPWAQARGAHAWGAPAQAAAPRPARRLHQDGSSEWVPGHLIVTTMRPAITRPSSSPKRAPCRASRGVRGDPGQGPVRETADSADTPLVLHHDRPRLSACGQAAGGPPTEFNSRPRPRTRAPPFL